MDVEQTSSHDLFDSNVYYSVEMIKELMPFLDDITYLVIYKSINAKFLDADDIAGVDKEIARYRRSYDHIMKMNLALFDASQNKIEENQ
jgi:hypothetical protein